MTPVDSSSAMRPIMKECVTHVDHVLAYRTK